MPQFGVYRFSGRNPDIRFLIQIQSNQLERTVDRVVMPAYRLNKPGMNRPGWPHRLSPLLVIADEEVYADPTNLLTIPVRKLGSLLLVLNEPEQDLVIAALDEMTSRA